MNNNLIILNDKLTQKVFNLKNLVDDEGTIDFDIDETGKKKFLTSVTITPAKGELLDAYDAQIFSYLVSRQQAGDNSATVREISCKLSRNFSQFWISRAAFSDILAILAPDTASLSSENLSATRFSSLSSAFSIASAPVVEPINKLPSAS